MFLVSSLDFLWLIDEPLMDAKETSAYAIIKKLKSTSKDKCYIQRKDHKKKQKTVNINKYNTCLYTEAG